MDAELATSHKTIIDPELLRPSRHRTAWTKCYVMKRDKTFMMFTEANNRFLLAGALVGDEFRISQDERFLEVHDPNLKNSAQPSAHGRFVAVLRRVPREPQLTLFSLACENCDNRLGRYTCEPLLSVPTPHSTTSTGKAGKATSGAVTPGSSAASVLPGLPAAPSAGSLVSSDTARQRLADVFQETIHLRQADVDIRCLRVVLPRVYEDLTRAVWCPRNRQGSGFGISPRPLLPTPSHAAGGSSASTTAAASNGSQVKPGTPAGGRPPSYSFDAAGGGSNGVGPTDGPAGIAGAGTPRLRAPSGSGYHLPLPPGVMASPKASPLSSVLASAAMVVGPGGSGGGSGSGASTGLAAGTPLLRAASATGFQASLSGGASPAAGVPFSLGPGTAAGTGVSMAAMPGTGPGLQPFQPGGGDAGRTNGLVRQTSNPGFRVSAAGPPSATFPGSGRGPVMPSAGGGPADAPALASNGTHAGMPGGGGPGTYGIVPFAAGLPHGSPAHGLLSPTTGMATALTPGGPTVVSSGAFPLATGPSGGAGELIGITARSRSEAGSIDSAPAGVSGAGELTGRSETPSASADALARRHSAASLRGAASPIAVAQAARAQDDAMQLMNRRPEWNEGMGSLTMKFLGGRISSSSSKNFLMELAEGARISPSVAGALSRLPPAAAAALGGISEADAVARQRLSSAASFTSRLSRDGTDGAGPGAGAGGESAPSSPVVELPPSRTPCLQFGKIRPGRFSCDFRFPLSPLQAFAIMLSGFYWTAAVDEADAAEEEYG